MRLLRLLVVLSMIAAGGFAAGGRARNVILFLGDAGGIPTLHAASLYKHNHPQKLFCKACRTSPCPIRRPPTPG